jgi:hypothetical protein
VSVDVMRVGIVALSACGPADLPIAEWEKQINYEHPTGVGPWTISTDLYFAAPKLPGTDHGPPNPCPCENSPDRVHRLFNC